jgi:hypothetical protein
MASYWLKLNLLVGCFIEGGLGGEASLLISDAQARRHHFERENDMTWSSTRNEILTSEIIFPSNHALLSWPPYIAAIHAHPPRPENY